MKKALLLLFTIIFVFSVDAAYASDVYSVQKSDSYIFNLAAFPLKTPREILHYMMENYAAERTGSFSADIPWSAGAQKINSETYVLPLRAGQVFKFKDVPLDIRTSGESFSFICSYDENDQISSIEIACELDSEYLDMMQVKSLFFDNYKALGLNTDPSVKGRADDNYYVASETIDGIIITISINKLDFRFSVGLS